MKTHHTPSYASLPMLALAVLFAALTQCFAQVPVASSPKPPVTKVEQLITQLPAGTLPKVSKVTPLELSQASAAVGKENTGKNVEFSLKLDRIDLSPSNSPMVRFSAADDFHAKGRKFSASVFMSLPKEKGEFLLTAKQGTPLKIRGLVENCHLTGWDSPSIQVVLKDCELR